MYKSQKVRSKTKKEKELIICQLGPFPSFWFFRRKIPGIFLLFNLVAIKKTVATLVVAAVANAAVMG
jgi:hypothetical protein